MRVHKFFIFKIVYIDSFLKLFMLLEHRHQTVEKEVHVFLYILVIADQVARDDLEWTLHRQNLIAYFVFQKLLENFGGTKHLEKICVLRVFGVKNLDENLGDSLDLWGLHFLFEALLLALA